MSEFITERRAKTRAMVKTGYGQLDARQVNSKTSRCHELDVIPPAAICIGSLGRCRFVDSCEASINTTLSTGELVKHIGVYRDEPNRAAIGAPA